MPHPNCSFVLAVGFANHTAFTHFATSHTRKRCSEIASLLSLQWAAVPASWLSLRDIAQLTAILNV